MTARSSLASLISNAYTYNPSTGKILINAGPIDPDTINYSSTDISNSKTDIYGLTSDFSSNTRLLVGQSSNYLDYTDDGNNSILIDNTGVNLNTPQYLNLTNFNNDSVLTNNHVLIQNLPNNGDPTNTTNDYIVMTNQAMNLHVEDQSNNNNFTYLHMEKDLISINSNTVDNSIVSKKIEIYNQPDTTTYPSLAKSGIEIYNNSIILASENISTNLSAIIAKPTELSLLSNGSIIIQPDVSMDSKITVSPSISTEISQTGSDIQIKTINSTALSEIDLNPDILSLIASNTTTSRIDLAPDNIDIFTDTGVGLHITPTTFSVNNITHGVTTQLLYYNTGSGLISYNTVPSNVSDVVLVGSGVHQFISGGSGTLDFRSMTSPLNTIAFNPTATNIEMDITLATSKNSSLRAGVDSSSNPDPLTNGLLIPTGSSEFQMPLTVTYDSGLGIASPYIDDVPVDYIVNSNYITINNAGNFEASFEIVFIGTVNPTIPIITEILRNGEAIFTSPPICVDCKMNGCDISVGPFSKAWTMSASSNCILSVGDELALVIQPNNSAADIVLELSSNFSLHRIDNDAFTGPQGPPGAVNSVINDISASNNLIENPGSNSNIIIKGIQAGTNITINDLGDNLEIVSAGGGGGPNNILINYQNTDLNTGTGNIISEIGNGDAGQSSLITCTTDTIQIFANNLIQITTSELQLPSLASNITSNTLYYDTISKDVTFGAISNTTQINYQTTDLAFGSGNVIDQINSGDAISSSKVICNINDLQLYSGGTTTINSVDINLPNLSNASTSNSVYYDTSSNLISYSPVQFGSKQIGLNVTASAVVGTTATLQNCNITANTFTGIVGEAIRFVINGTINNVAVSIQSNTILLRLNGGNIATFTFNSTLSSTGSYELCGELITQTYSAPNSTWFYNARLTYTDNSFSTISQVICGTVTCAINSTISLDTRAAPAGLNTTITQKAFKIWKD